MTNFEYLQKVDNSLEAAHVFCELVGIVADERGEHECDICPFGGRCEYGYNFIQTYLEGERK